MDTTPGHRPARELRALLRADLVAAMKARRPEAVSALRTALAAIDNAEAVTAPAGTGAAGSEHVAGASTGVGSTEAPRRVLSAEELHGLLHAQVAERRAEAGRYTDHGRHDAAERLRAEADVLAGYLTDGTGGTV
ncbi:GatB/YqeY domain-containing protein [Nocardiopsis sp. CC223A]|uniref:GatB/YqeY domain-containing protein n=1 Tax=Nocardiopsis sp. CC223A TaxID=3044051 RepID=UPI00279623D5|nr:GatB/YqeY domain-containing protein [Nocardiopsis sp. CC223A]